MVKKFLIIFIYLICLIPGIVFAGSSDSDITFSSDFDDKYTYGDVKRCVSKTGLAYFTGIEIVNGNKVCLWNTEYKAEVETFICEDKTMEKFKLGAVTGSDGVSYYGYGCRKIKDENDIEYIKKEIQVGSGVQVASQYSNTCTILEGNAGQFNKHNSCWLDAEKDGVVRIKVANKTTNEATYYEYKIVESNQAGENTDDYTENPSNQEDNSEENATSLFCEYSDDNVLFTVYIQDGNLTYDYNKGGSFEFGVLVVKNTLEASDFYFDGKYQCLPKIYYNLDDSDYHKYYFGPTGNSFLNLTDSSILEDTEEEAVPNLGDNTENPSTDEDNNQVNVSFWGNLDVIQCGSTTVPAPVPPLVRLVVMALKIVTPFVLIIMGMVDMLKAVIGSKDDEIKKEQQKFIKRVIAAVLVFFVVSILQFVVSFVAPEDTDSVLRCVDCLINDASKCN